MQLVAKAFHGSVDMLKLRKLAKLAIPGAIKKLVLVLPLTNPDHILLALLQGGLRVQLSGLEPEIREGEKAVFRTSLHPWGAISSEWYRLKKKVVFLSFAFIQL